MRVSTTPPSAGSEDATLGGLLDGGALAPPEIARRHARERVRDGLFGTGGHVQVGRFRIVRTLGEGAMGVVYAAHDPLLDREVALKLVHATTVSSTAATARLRNEARAMARLSHPNVVPVYEVLEHEGDVVVVMELVRGTDLGTWIGGRRSWREVVRALVDAGRGLAAAHAVGVVHRDFKPQNVLVGPDGRARVTDFGLAHEEDIATTVPRRRGSSEHTHAGAIVGTPAYLAPECWAGVRAGPAADQFAFAVTAYELLFGHRPFAGDTVVEVARRIGSGRMQPMPSRSAVPRRVRDAVQRGLAPEPAQRHASMDAIVVELESALRQRRRVTPFVVAGAAAIAIAVLAPSRAPALTGSTPCHGFDPAGGRAWTDDRRAAVAQLGDAELGAWRDAELEGYAGELRRVRATACGSADRSAAAAQLQCLDALERDHATTLDLLARGDLDPRRTVALVDGLVAPSRCSSAADDSVPDPEVAALLSEARVLMRAGRARDAYPAAVLACTRLPRHDVAQWAECRLATGWALLLLGRFADARPSLEEAFDVAVAVRHDGLVREAAEGLAKIAVNTADAASARRWREELRAVGRRLGDPSAEVEAGLLEAELLARMDHLTEAVAVLEAVATSPEATAIGPRPRADVEVFCAITYGRAGESARAHEHFDRALALLDTLPTPDAERASVLAMRAQQLGIDGRYHEALEDYRAALALEPPARDSVDNTVLKALDGIADTLTRLGRIDEAREAAEENVRAATTTGSDDDLADALLTRGRLHIAAEAWDAARRDAAEALVLHEANHGVHSRTAAARSLLAHALQELGQLDEARRMAEEAIADMGATLGERHPDTLATNIMLANIEESLGNLERAMELHAYVRDGLAETLGPGHPTVGIAVYNLGLARLHADDLPGAIAEFEHAHAIWTAALGEEHPDTMDAAENVAELRRQLAARG